MPEPTGTTENSWPSRPPQAAMEHAWSIRRAPRTGAKLYLVLSHDVIGKPCHYWHGRTRPCEGPACPACANNQEPRWYGYVAAKEHATALRVLLELTPQCMAPIDEFFRAHRTLRGSIIELSRVNARGNGRVVARIREATFDVTAIEQAPKIKPMLLRMWGIKATTWEAGIQTEILPLKKTGTDDQEHLIF